MSWLVRRGDWVMEMLLLDRNAVNHICSHRDFWIWTRFFWGKNVTGSSMGFGVPPKEIDLWGNMKVKKNPKWKRTAERRLYYIITVWLVYQQLYLNGSKACFSLSVLYCGYCIIMLLYSLPRRLFLWHHHYGLLKVATLNTNDSFSIRHSIPFQSYSSRHKNKSNVKVKEEKQE